MTDTNIDQLLDATLDDLADLPEFKNFPPGAHKLLATFSLKEISNKKAIELKLKLIETVEKADETSEDSKPGDECSMAFFLDNEFAQGKLKKLSAPFKESMGIGSLRELIDQVNDIECMAITSLRQDKNDKDKTYLDVKEIAIV